MGSKIALKNAQDQEFSINHNDNAGAISINSSDISLKSQTESEIAPYNKGFKNYIINGGFDIWQRGISFTNLTNGSYSADRWVVYDAVGNINYNVIRNVGLFDGGHGITYTWNSGTGLRSVVQFIENVARFKVGTQVTVSFEAYTNSTPYTISVGVQGVRGTWAAATGVTSTNITLTNTKTRYTATVTVPDWTTIGIDWTRLEDTKLALKFDMGVETNGRNFILSNVQLEKGSVATPFENRPYGLELSLCQRYYEKVDSVRCNIPVYGTGPNFIGSVKFKVRKRIEPSISFGTASHWRTIVINNGAEISILNAIEITPEGFDVLGTSSAGNIPAGFAGKIQVNDVYLYSGIDGIFASAEL